MKIISFWDATTSTCIQTLHLATIRSFHLQGTKCPECGGSWFAQHVQVYFTDYKSKFQEDSKRQEDEGPADFTQADLQNTCKIQPYS
jgi:hypothetical protein